VAKKLAMSPQKVRRLVKRSSMAGVLGKAGG